MKRLISIILSMTILLISCPVAYAETFTESVFEDPGRYSDEDFFGVWENGEWVVDSKINYDYDEQLKTVEEAVKNGDYYKAKADLMYYYQNRDIEPQLATTRDPLSAVMLYNDIYFSQAPVMDIVEISETPEWHEFDVTNGVIIGTACYTLHMIERDFCEEGEEGIAYFNSRESDEFKPYLEVEQDGEVYTFSCSGDMYIRGGRYASMNYGKENQIHVSEWGSVDETDRSAVTNGTRQAHIRFSTGVLDSEKPITRAILKLYGYASAPGKHVGAFLSSITTAWDEKEITYLEYPNQIGNFQGVDGGFNWRGFLSAHMQFYNVLSRLNLLSGFFVEARETKNPEYERKALEIFIDFIKDINGLTNDWYASEKRLNAAFRNFSSSQQCFFNALHFSELDPIAFGAMIKFMYQEAEAMSGPPMEGQINLNGLSSIIGSLLCFSTYFPEFTGRDHYLEKANTRLFEWIDQCLYSDGSYRESSSGYDAGVLSAISEFYNVVKGSDISIPEEFNPYYRAFAVSQMNLTQPDKWQFRWGDGGIKRDMGDRILEAAYNLDDTGELLYYGTNGEEGVLPDYTSYFAPVGKVGVMRSDWTDRGVSAFIIGRLGGSHAHHHMNSINLYAYDRILITDTGRASYDARHPSVAWQSNRAESHNTVEVNDHGQKISFTDGDYDLSAATMTMNSKMDFYDGESNANPEEAVHTRKLAFVKNHKFYIVTDFMENLNEQENKYNQVWHVSASGSTMDMDKESKILKTHYDSGANLSIVPVSPYNLSSGSIATNPIGKHVSYVINSDKNAYMSVLLYPFENEALDIATNEIPVSGNDDNSATAFTIDIPGGTEGLYFVNNSDEIRRFDKYDADAGMFYLEKNTSGETQMFSASAVKSVDENNEVLLKANRKLTDVSVSYKDKFVEVECSDEFNSDEDYIMIKVPDSVDKVRFNGEIVSYFKLNGCIVIGTYWENLRYNIENNNAVAKIPAMVAEYFYDGGSFKAEIAGGTVVTTNNEWDGKLVLANISNTELKAGKTTLGKINILSGEANIPLRFSFEDISVMVAPVIDGKAEEPEEKLSADSFDSASGMSGNCAIYTDNEKNVIYSKVLGEFVVYKTDATVSSGNSQGSDKAPSSGHISKPSGGGGGNSGGGSSSGSTVVVPPVETTVNPFEDINSHWAKDYILDLHKNGIVQGEGNLFYPDRTITRAEVTAMIVRCAKLEEAEEISGIFSDVDENSWFASVVETAAKNNIVSGKGDGFAPLDNITRAELCKIVMNTYYSIGKDAVNKKEIDFSDLKEFPSWAEEAIVEAVSLGILQGYPDGSFMANNTATRAEVAVVVKKLTELINK